MVLLAGAGSWSVLLPVIGFVVWFGGGCMVEGGLRCVYSVIDSCALWFWWGLGCFGVVCFCRCWWSVLVFCTGGLTLWWFRGGWFCADFVWVWMMFWGCGCLPGGFCFVRGWYNIGLVVSTWGGLTLVGFASVDIGGQVLVSCVELLAWWF